MILAFDVFVIKRMVLVAIIIVSPTSRKNRTCPSRFARFFIRVGHLTPVTDLKGRGLWIALLPALLRLIVYLSSASSPTSSSQCQVPLSASYLGGDTEPSCLLQAIALFTR